jgi:hypothetical protein
MITEKIENGFKVTFDNVEDEGRFQDILNHINNRVPELYEYVFFQQHEQIMRTAREANIETNKSNTN